MLKLLTVHQCAFVACSVTILDTSGTVSYREREVIWEKMDPKGRNAMPSPDAIKQALTRVVTSETFVSSPRLKDFLTYIVEEYLAGRDNGIKGKAIAVDVYQRELDEAGSAQNLVRVEAGRLRRVLTEYYSQEGQTDPVRIWVDAGSYRPRFESILEGGKNEAAPGPEPELPHPTRAHWRERIWPSMHSWPSAVC